MLGLDPYEIAFRKERVRIIQDESKSRSRVARDLIPSQATGTVVTY